MYIIFLLATTTTTTTRCFDICWQEDCVTGANTSIHCPTTTIATSSSPPTATTSLSKPTCQDLEDELRQVKLGLGLGLGFGMVITSGIAIGTYIYFSRRIAQLLIPSASFARF
ncbi:unnamed protein product [Rotaria sp. Silwood1]|nr:unnamed protein product [Rotaria sp. Silwood1]CAF1574497.1 unnamed protein product [Rotaria sp. Silwood1]